MGVLALTAHCVLNLRLWLVVSAAFVQVAYKVVAGPRPIMEAAAAAGFAHICSGCMEQCLLNIGCRKISVKHERAAILIHSYKDEWGWSKVDEARALSHVLPGCKGPRRQPPRPQGAEPNIKWESIRALATAMGMAEDMEIPSETVAAEALPVQNNEEALYQALGYDVAAVAQRPS